MVGELVHLGGEPGDTRIPAPPAPDPLNGVSTTWGELFDTLMYLADEGELATLRNRLKALANATDGLPLPADIFDMGPDHGGAT